MSSKTRKFIWSVPVVAAFAVIGALAVFVALGIQNAAPVEAQSTGPYTISVTGGGPGSGFPSAPRNLLVTVLDADSVRLAWDHPTDQRGTRDVPVIQQVEQSERPDASTVWDPTTISPAATADSVSVTVTGLSDDEEYFFSVQSTTSTGSGDRAVIGPVTPKDIAVPSAPSNVRAVPGTVATALSVSWDAPDSQGDAPITAYSATVTLTSDDTEVSGATVTVNVEQRTATITGLAANTEYTVSVTANNAGGPSPAAEATATTTLLPTAEITNDPSTTGSAGLRLVLKIEADGIQEMAAGDRVEVFLENDYAVPSSISISSVSFIIGSGATPNNANAAYGSTISAASVSVADGGDIPGTDTDGDAHSIVAEIPDFDPRDDNRYFPNASPVVSDTLTLVIETSAGIKNPSEQGKHSVGYSVLTGVETADGTAERKLPDLETKAKISLDSDDGGRGDEVIITGSGFNNGTIAEAYVLKEPGAEPGCQTIIDKGTSLGTEHLAAALRSRSTLLKTLNSISAMFSDDKASPELAQPDHLQCAPG